MPRRARVRRRRILRAESFPDYDTFVTMLDGLIELQALSLLLIKRLECLYTEECVAWDRAYRESSGRVSKHAAPAIAPRSGQSGRRDTPVQESSNKLEEAEGSGDDPVGERVEVPTVSPRGDRARLGKRLRRDFVTAEQLWEEPSSSFASFRSTSLPGGGAAADKSREIS